MFCFFIDDIPSLFRVYPVLISCCLVTMVILKKLIDDNHIKGEPSHIDEPGILETVRQ